MRQAYTHKTLAYLHRLPLDTLKIDRSFVHPAGQPGVVDGLAEKASRVHGCIVNREE